MKEVDIYCDWIDEAHAINSKKQKSIGLVDASDDDDPDNPEHLQHESEESKEAPRVEKPVEVKKVVKSVLPLKKEVKAEDSADDLF